ncbi:MAG: tetratricopeptide repeat protein, partial [Verrucomicrobiota bacterium]|nr:tetratricopeptide repeat protein [Verrucomicrobiota bacterium]
KIIDLILSVLTIASVLFLLTIIVISSIKWVMNWYYKRTFEEMFAKAKSGDALAQNNLGVMYNEGLGVNQDIEEAMTWFNTAAEQKLPEAEYNLQALLEEHPELRED